MPVYVNLESYLSKLKALESTKSKEERRPVPSLSELAACIGMHQTTINRIANNAISNLNLETADKIITEMRQRGFQMDVSDLLAYIPPES